MNLKEAYEVLGKMEGGGEIIASIQEHISNIRAEAASNRVERNKVLDALGLRDKENAEEALKAIVTSINALQSLGTPEQVGGKLQSLENQVKELTGKYEASEKTAKEEKAKRVQAAIDLALTNALTKGNAVKPDVFSKLISDRVIVNADDTLTFKSGDKTVSIEDGVKEWLSANTWAVKNTAQGGAGSGGTSPSQKTYTMDDLKGMTPEEINSNWDNIQKSFSEKKG